MFQHESVPLKHALRLHTLHLLLQVVRGHRLHQLRLRFGREVQHRVHSLLVEVGGARELLFERGRQELFGLEQFVVVDVVAHYGLHLAGLVAVWCASLVLQLVPASVHALRARQSFGHSVVVELVLLVPLDVVATQVALQLLQTLLEPVSGRVDQCLQVGLRIVSRTGHRSK